MTASNTFFVIAFSILGLSGLALAVLWINWWRSERISKRNRRRFKIEGYSGMP